MASADVGAQAPGSKYVLELLQERNFWRRAQALIEARGIHPDGGFSPMSRDPDHIALVGQRLALVEQALEALPPQLAA